ncbi:hypothetical protein GH722_17120 [Alphaproteobacteria bacterium HT1-32]|nr:hypothetical protein [Alphaproteobacteria bacterium HT1-32]
MRFFLLNFVLFLMLMPSNSRSESISTVISWGEDPAWIDIASGSEIKVVASDGVSDGCWTNVAQTRDSVAIELQRSGYKINLSDDGYSASRLIISVSGYGIKNQSCAVLYEFLFVTMTVGRDLFSQKHTVMSLRDVELWRKSGIMTGPKKDMSYRIKDEFISLTQRFILEVPQLRKSALKSINDVAGLNKLKDPEAYKFWSNYELK